MLMVFACVKYRMGGGRTDKVDIANPRLLRLSVGHMGGNPFDEQDNFTIIMLMLHGRNIIVRRGKISGF